MCRSPPRGMAAARTKARRGGQLQGVRDLPVAERSLCAGNAKFGSHPTPSLPLLLHSHREELVLRDPRVGVVDVVREEVGSALLELHEWYEHISGLHRVRHLRLAGD